MKLSNDISNSDLDDLINFSVLVDDEDSISSKNISSTAETLSSQNNISINKSENQDLATVKKSKTKIKVAKNKKRLYDKF